MKAFLRRHWVLTAGALAVLSVIGGVALAPRWIDLAAVRTRLEAAASKAAGGSVSSTKIRLVWRPTPEAALESVRVVSPAVTASVARVRVGFAFGPLLRGRFEPSNVSIEGADVFLRRKDGRGIWVEGLDARASLDVRGGSTRVSVSRLAAASPALTLEGVFRSSPSAASISAHGSIDVAGLRSALLGFAGDDRTISQVFAIFRGGRLTSFTFESAAPSPSDLFALERMKIRAKVEDARVFVEGPDLDLRGVSADVALDGGVLTAERASARLGKSRAEGGTVLVGLAPGDGRLRVEARVKADLSEVPAILGRAIPDRSFREELALVEGLEGSATGKIAIGDCAGDLNTGVSVSDLRFSATYRRLPWPLRVDGGEFTFDGHRVGVERLSGSFGRSTFSGLAAGVRLGRSAYLENALGSIEVSLEDFLEGARSIRGAESLVRSVRRLEGSLHVDVRRVSGPLARLGEASVAASGTFKEILFSSSSSSSSLPPLSIPSGSFAVDDEAVRVFDAAVRALDASLRVSGAWSGWRGGAATIEATADGELGPEAIRWGWERAALPAGFRPAAPIAARDVRVSLTGGGALSLAGGLVVANGPRVTLDMAQEGGKTDFRSLTIADGGSLASLPFRLQDRELDLRFKGRLDGATLSKIFVERSWRGGAIEGDVAAHVPLEAPARLTAEGTLTATAFEIPSPAGPVTVERLDLSAAKNVFDVRSASVILDGQRFSAAGGVTLREGGVSLDLASLAWQSFVFKPVLADVRFGDETVVTLRKADTCGISTAGEARVLPGGALAVDARASAAGPDINVPLACLGVENVGMTGSYEANVRVEGQGPASGLPRALRGPLTFKAARGRIGKATLLTRILGVLNATDVFAGKSGGRVGDAMPYDSLTLEGELAGGSVAIREAAFVAPSLTMAATGTVGLPDRSLDLMVLSHPLSTVDKVVHAVPVVKTILGRDFLAVAVKVTGSLGDPKARVTPGRDVGKGLVGILQRTVTLPVTVFDPPPERR